MSALFEEQELDLVKYSSEAIDTNFGLTDLIIDRERHALAKAEEIIGAIGGKVSGPDVRHSGGVSLDHFQFEAVRHIND